MESGPELRGQHTGAQGAVSEATVCWPTAPTQLHALPMWILPLVASAGQMGQGAQVAGLGQQN